MNSKEELIDVADNICINLIKKYGLNFETIHLSPYEILKQFERELEVSFRKNDIDLSFNSAVSNAYGCKVSGNTGGMANSYVHYFWNCAWEKISMTKLELQDYLTSNPLIEVYQNGEYWAVKKYDKEKLLSIKFGVDSHSRGYGSQSSIADNHIELKKDKLGNLLVNKYCLIYD